MSQKTGRKQLKIQPTRKGYIHHKNKMFCKERFCGDSKKKVRDFQEFQGGQDDEGKNTGIFGVVKLSCVMW